jgi:hypothetical protein
MGELVGKKLLGVPRDTRTNYIELGLNEIVWGSELDYLTRDRDQ